MESVWNKMWLRTIIVKVYVFAHIAEVIVPILTQLFMLVYLITYMQKVLTLYFCSAMAVVMCGHL